MGIQNMNINSSLKLFNSTSVLFSKSALLTRTADTHIHIERQFHNRESTHFDANPFSSPLIHPLLLLMPSLTISVKCFCAQLLEMSAMFLRQSNATLCDSWLELHKEMHDATWHLTDFLCCLWLVSPNTTVLQGDSDAVLSALQGARGCQAARRCARHELVNLDESSLIPPCMLECRPQPSVSKQQCKQVE